MQRRRLVPVAAMVAVLAMVPWMIIVMVGYVHRGWRL
jgi:hypothetical protein